MDSLFQFLTNQVGVNGIFFAFTLILAGLVYKEWQSEKVDAKERDQMHKEEKEKMMVQLDISSRQVEKSIETINKFDKHFENSERQLNQISNKLDILSEKVGK